MRRDVYEQSFRAERVLIHPEFRQNGPYSSDIALIKVRSTNLAGIPFNAHVHPICIESIQEHDVVIARPGTWCTVTGWGQTLESDRNSVSITLRAASVPVVDDKLCRQQTLEEAKNRAETTTARLHQPILGSMLCAGKI